MSDIVERLRFQNNQLDEDAAPHSPHRRRAMESETDAEFLFRFAMDFDFDESEDLIRLFALARRGASAVQQPCHETCEPSRGQHHINCPNSAKAYTPPSGEPSDE